MGNCLIKKQQVKYTNTIDTCTVLFPHQGAYGKGAMIVSGDYNLQYIWDMGSIYHVRVHYWMYPDSYTTQTLSWSTNNSNWSQFASASPGTNIQGSFETTARYIRNYGTVPGSGMMLAMLFALRLD